MVTEDNMAEIISLIEQGHVNYIFHVPTREYIRIDKIDNLQGNRLEPGRTLVLRELRDGDFVLANRQPTLHKNSILGFIVKLHDGDTIQIHPSASTSFGADWTKLSRSEQAIAPRLHHTPWRENYVSDVMVT
jgi:DNA-directed RNA polymerase beta' subunit